MLLSCHMEVLAAALMQPGSIACQSLDTLPSVYCPLPIQGRRTNKTALSEHLISAFFLIASHCWLYINVGPGI